MPKCLDCNMGNKSHLLHVRGWDMDQTKKPKNASNTFLVMIFIILGISYHTDVCFRVKSSGKIGFNCVFVVVIDSWDWQDLEIVAHYRANSWLQTCQMAVFISGILWLHFWIMRSVVLLIVQSMVQTSKKQSPKPKLIQLHQIDNYWLGDSL